MWGRFSNPPVDLKTKDGAIRYRAHDGILTHIGEKGARALAEEVHAREIDDFIAAPVQNGP